MHYTHYALYSLCTILTRYFDLFGYDVMLDEGLQLHLLEVSTVHGVRYYY
jgi:hypothetical protein